MCHRQQAIRLLHHCVLRFCHFLLRIHVSATRALARQIDTWGVTQQPTVLCVVLNCICFNARSLCNKLTSLNALLGDIVYNAVFDFIFVTKTSFNNEKITDGLILNGSNNYCILRKHRLYAATGGGICLIFNSKLKCCLVPLSQKFLHLQILSVDVYFCKFKRRYIVLYRPLDIYLDYTVKLFECFNLLRNVHCLCYVCGDFNLLNFNWFNLSVGVPAAENCLVNFISHNGLGQLMLSPTHDDNITDLLITIGKYTIFNVELQPAFNHSAHAAITKHMQRPSVSPNSNKATHNFARADYDSLAKYLNDIDWLALFLPTLPNDVNGLWHIFKKIVCDAIDLHVLISLGNNIKHPTNSRFTRLALNKKCALWCKRKSKLGQ